MKIKLFCDLYSCWSFRYAIFYTAAGDIRARYRRSVLGPMWIIIGLGASSAGLGFMWGALLGEELRSIVPRITIGLLIWYFISSVLTEGVAIFTIHSEIVKNMRLPKSFLPLQLMTKHLIVFAHGLPIMLLAVIFSSEPISWLTFLAIPNMLLCFSIMFSLMYICAFLSTRYRDLAQIVQIAMPVLFFLSPVLFKVEQLQNMEWLIWLNPFSYIILLISNPMLGRDLDQNVYVISVIMLISLLACLSILFHFKSHRLTSWV